MIQEYVREMTAEERASFQHSIRATPTTLPPIRPTTMALVAAAALTVVVAAWIGIRGLVPGGVAAALAAVGLLGLYDFIKACAADRRMLARRVSFVAESERALARVLADGRVTVKRVRAVAVVEMEPIEDEGTGYLFDLGDGRVLFLKGQFYSPSEDEEGYDPPWPNTEFEIVRTVAEGRMLDLTCHGQALAPVRIIRGDDLDPESAWAEREEVLDLTLDQAVKTVLGTS